MDRWHPMRGFSLIEMLVALTVFSLVVLALLNLAGENTRAAVVIHERVMAGLVAENLAAEAMLAGSPALREHASGERETGDMNWRWSRRLQATDNPRIARIDITVTAADGEQIAAELSLFRGMQ